jgi:queuine tRNA-ribosyltransferase
LDSDIRMVLDVCTPYPAEREVVERDLDLTLEWATRSRAAWEATEPTGPSRGALFGIVQGGTHPDLRSRAARELVSLGLDGYALGGLSVGEPAELRPDAIDAAVAELPAASPRYLMGVGTPLDILDAVGRGIDLFDCVLPTRNARKGSVFSWNGRMTIKSRAFADDPRPIDPECECAACRRYSRAYIRHLFQVGELLAGRLATIHSVAFYQQFMARMREAILCKRFAEFARAARERWV